MSTQSRVDLIEGVQRLKDELLQEISQSEIQIVQLNQQINAKLELLKRLDDLLGDPPQGHSPVS